MDYLNENNNNAFEKNDNVNDNEASLYNKLGTLISERYLSRYINKEIFFIGEIVSIQDNKINLKSVNGNCVDCIINDKNFKSDSKYIGIKGTVSNDLKIVETRDIISLEDVNFDLVNEYINIYMDNINSEVFLPSY